MRKKYPAVDYIRHRIGADPLSDPLSSRSMYQAVDTAALQLQVRDGKIKVEVTTTSTQHMIRSEG